MQRLHLTRWDTLLNPRRCGNLHCTDDIAGAYRYTAPRMIAQSLDAKSKVPESIGNIGRSGADLGAKSAVFGD